MRFSPHNYHSKSFHHSRLFKGSPLQYSWIAHQNYQLCSRPMLLTHKVSNIHIRELKKKIHAFLTWDSWLVTRCPFWHWFFMCQVLIFVTITRCLSCLNYLTKWTELALNYPSHKRKPERMADQSAPRPFPYMVRLHNTSRVFSVLGPVSEDGDSVHCVVGRGWNKCASG